ncbi:MAG: NAD-dependent epimerase/dehydratase family protein [Candidatus Poseidoniaceae archaeon]|jgi:nucleoside-diphosphate-sugar epimerase|nr:NAD-dependent epimerase/dehydratase family protein [Candidatus Poseidoniaceae archaeon]
MFDGKKVLVTGGAGFLGSDLVEKLLAKGALVVAIDNLFRGKLSNLQTFVANDDFTFIEGDVCLESDLLKCESIHSGFDVIYHLAAVNGTKWFHEEARDVIENNIVGTLRTLESAQRCNARYVLASSPEAFGDSKQQPLKDGNPMVFSNPAEHQRHSYGASKYLDEVATQHAIRQGLDARIVRPFNAYGPKLLGDEYGQVVAMFFQSVLENEPIMIHGDGSQTRSFTWIDDVTEGFIKAASNEAESGDVFNIGSEEEVSICTLQEMVFAIVSEDETWFGGLPSITKGQGYHGDSVRRLPDVTNNKKIMWQAKVSLRQGLERMWVLLR